MIGFTIAHVYPWFLIIGILGILAAIIWWIISLLMLARKSRRATRAAQVPLVAVPLFAVLLFIPYEIWTELMIRVNGPGSFGPTYLVESSALGDSRLVKYLIEHGVDVNSVHRDSTALSAAAVEGKTDIALYLISVGADVNHRGFHDSTPLHNAAEMGHIDTVKALIAHGAEVCALDLEGHSAAGAARQRHPDIAKYLDDNYHCKETAITGCDDPRVSACVHEN